MPTTRRNPQDLTLRNLRAMKKQIAALKRDVAALKRAVRVSARSRISG